MKDKSFWSAIVRPACLVVILLPTSVEAGTVILVNNKYEKVCAVEVTGGLNAPNSEIKTFQSITKGEVTRETDQLCYRRSRDPQNCGSGLTDWTCEKWAISGEKIMKLN